MTEMKAFFDEHGSTICTAGAVVGVLLTIYETWETRPKVDKLLQDAAMEKAAVNEDESLSEEEKKRRIHEINVQTWKGVAVTALPMIGSGVGTCGLSIASRVIDARKMADMAATISLGDVAYRKLMEKTEHLIGTEKTTEIKKEIAEEDVKKALHWSDEDDVHLDFRYAQATFGGDEPYYDVMLGRVILCDDQTILKACMEANKRVTSGADPYMSYNELCMYQLGLPGVGAADYIGVGGRSPAQLWEPNLDNAIVVSGVAVKLLDWHERPTGNFKC